MKRGFSLVELAIVLVILGLITGGILSGQALIRNAKLQSVMQDLEVYHKAVGIFQETYKELPGDMRRATQIWGRAGGGTGDCADNFYDTGTGTETCNGNGNGLIESNNGSTQTFELHRFWQHLVNAGLIPGKFTGTPGATGTSNRTYTIVSVNGPGSRLADNAGFSFGTGNVADATHPNMFPGDYRHMFHFGAQTSNAAARGDLLTPKEMESIDKKADDNLPAYGKIRTFRGGSLFNPNCANSSDPDAARYNVSFTTAACSIMFIGNY